MLLAHLDPAIAGQPLTRFEIAHSGHNLPSAMSTNVHRLVRVGLFDNFNGRFGSQGLRDGDQINECDDATRMPGE